MTSPTPQLPRYGPATLFKLGELMEEIDRHDVVGIHSFLIPNPRKSSTRAVLAIAWYKWTQTASPPWVLHVTSQPPSEVTHIVELLTELFASESITKIVHASRNLAHWLHTNGLDVTQLRRTIELQLAHEERDYASSRDESLREILDDHATAQDDVPLIPGDDVDKPMLAMKTRLALTLSATLVHRCFTDTLHFLLSSPQKERYFAVTRQRWILVSQHGVLPLIWFDEADMYRRRSLECMMIHADAEVIEPAMPMPPLELVCDIDSLLVLLPQRVRDAVEQITHYSHKLEDACLDLGRTPHAYAGRRHRINLSTAGEASAPAVVQQSDIDTVIYRLGGETKIKPDNRAGVDGQLHRISVLRSTSDEIYGVTLRVGRSLRFASNYLLDVLLGVAHRHKSVLILGVPGSGKTTLVRDIARCIAETGENVCVMDTSNEIGGDGLVPHECIGLARRMMVKTLGDQARVMVECVQNHTVDTMIIDEIGRASEVNAASTVKQRGPRLIASAHGDFYSLLKNVELRGLVGGVQAVTVGDALASKENKLGKIRPHRLGPPVFDVVVEINRMQRGRCRIIWDVAHAVDCVLTGNKTGFVTETRYQSASLPGVQVIAA